MYWSFDLIVSSLIKKDLWCIFFLINYNLKNIQWLKSRDAFWIRYWKISKDSQKVSNAKMRIQYAKRVRRFISFCGRWHFEKLRHNSRRYLHHIKCQIRKKSLRLNMKMNKSARKSGIGKVAVSRTNSHGVLYTFVSWPDTLTLLWIKKDFHAFSDGIHSAWKIYDFVGTETLVNKRVWFSYRIRICIWSNSLSRVLFIRCLFLSFFILID